MRLLAFKWRKPYRTTLRLIFHATNFPATNFPSDELSATNFPATNIPSTIYSMYNVHTYQAEKSINRWSMALLSGVYCIIKYLGFFLIFQKDTAITPAVFASYRICYYSTSSYYSIINTDLQQSMSLSLDSQNLARTKLNYILIKFCEYVCLVGIYLYRHGVGYIVRYT